MGKTVLFIHKLTDVGFALIITGNCANQFFMIPGFSFLKEVLQLTPYSEKDHHYIIQVQVPICQSSISWVYLLGSWHWWRWAMETLEDETIWLCIQRAKVYENPAPLSGPFDADSLAEFSLLLVELFLSPFLSGPQMCSITSSWCWGFVLCYKGELGRQMQLLHQDHLLCQWQTTFIALPKENKQKTISLGSRE